MVTKAIHCGYRIEEPPSFLELCTGLRSYYSDPLVEVVFKVVNLNTGLSFKLFLTITLVDNTGGPGTIKFKGFERNKTYWMGEFDYCGIHSSINKIRAT